MAKSSRGRRRVTRAKNTARPNGLARRGGAIRTVRTVAPGRGPRGSDSGVVSTLVANAMPEQLLGVLGTAEDPAELMNQLEQAGLLPSAEEILAGVLDGWTPLLRTGCDPLEAELCGAEFLGVIRRLVPGEPDLAEIVTEMIAEVETRGTRDAMAMASVLAVLGPGGVRSAASAAAARLAAAGLAAPPWASELGRPTIGTCFGYADPLGEQQAIALCFSYRRKRHAVCVLIDHVLGGGIKDCFVSARPDQVRADYRRSARGVGLDCEDYSPAEAASILGRALDREPCPEQPDQVEDVGDLLDLLRSRLELLSGEGSGGSSASRALQRVPAGQRTGAGQRTAAGRRGQSRACPMIHQVKITLRGAKPPIWRRLEVPSDMKLSRLHECVQQAFGWYGYHLWVFSTPDGEFGDPDPELGHRSASARSLGDVAPAVGDRIRYTYDFGDDWEHEIAVEEVRPAEGGVAYPRCTAGRRACPPEDCGGIWGYQELLEVLADPRHPEHAERLEWLGLRSAAEFDAAAFDLDEANRALEGLARILVRD
jgi:Plasmid pRiA4b ORF-3-like protein